MGKKLKNEKERFYKESVTTRILAEGTFFTLAEAATFIVKSNDSGQKFYAKPLGYGEILISYNAEGKETVRIDAPVYNGVVLAVIVAEGISRRVPGDEKTKHGETLAIGRAKKALFRKVFSKGSKAQIRDPFAS